jgi:DNA-binding response OmpR family regulator
VILTDLECDVQTAPDGLSGLNLALHRSYDIVIVDNVLPVMNGREVCRRLAELPPERKPLTIFQSISLGSYKDRNEALASGADVLMAKEPGAENIVARVRLFLDTQPIPEALSR